jgi:hypothetical protein
MNSLNKSGMYSKAGLLTEEMFTMLQQKRYILYNEKKSLKPPKNRLQEEYLLK